ncbi:MAG: hypothetical protein JJ992_13405, partial [Planctomycetes bacterium]|nr:hypothetical protein [Planctomycetota bacterium]
MVTSESLDTEVQVPTGNRNDPPRLLSEDQQDLFLEVLSHGASPAMACRKLHLLLTDANHTRRLDADFAQRWQQIEQALSQNVASALYSSAMKGTASAQTFYLKQQPPPGWDRDANREPLRGDNFEECTDAELVELARTMGIDPTPEITGGNEPAGDEEISGSLLAGQHQ